MTIKVVSSIMCVRLLDGMELMWGGIKAIIFDTLLLSANEKFVLKLVVVVEVELSCRHFSPISQ